MNKTDL